ncbi:MAG: lactonase family protein [Candidatus Hydrogenedentes bacterium]|nr:lactonase family protein [Candidatus Hydrogenedentota bacterium]
MKRNTLAVVCGLVALAACAHGETWRVYVGTYTSGDSKGIYGLDFDGDTGNASLRGLAAETRNPSFLALHPTEPVLYACSELEDGANVAAFAIDEASGALSIINGQPAGGSACHVAVSGDGKYAAVANYGAGSCSIYPLEACGALGAAIGNFQHEGSSVNEKRQNAPHAHSANFDPSGKFVIVPDLGIDKLMIYKIDGGKAIPNDPPFATVEPGGGPRHFDFHPNKKWAYVVNELGNTVTAFKWDAKKGALETVGSAGTLPSDFIEENTTAHIEVHPSGRFLYASNRGHDSIAVFAIDQSTGMITAKGQTKTGGKTPRNFTQDPDGKFLLAANQNSNDIFVFSIDQESGALTPTGGRIEVPSPVCLVFAEP